MEASIQALTNVSYGSVDDKGVLNLIAQVRKGIPGNLFYSVIMKSFSFSAADWASLLHLSERTLQRYRAANKTFEPLQSERILELTMLLNYGAAVFGSKEAFDTWLSAESIALGGIRPKAFLDTSYGINLLKDELTRIEHGVLA
jgi:putative toxin-antitoxin system antitoxin component (TIGR02293 family)